MDPDLPDDARPRPTIYCSFCGKSQHDVERLVAGPTVQICDECVALASEIVAEERLLEKLRRGDSPYGVLVPRAEADRLAAAAAAAPAPPVAAVRQEDEYGCVAAVCAAVLGVPYADVARDLGALGRGAASDTWSDYLSRRGLAVQFHYRYDPLSNLPRTPWPLEPWADLHVCSVDAGRGDGSHVVLMLRDGTVLDSAADGPRRLADYASVGYVAALHRVGVAAAPPAPSQEPR